MYLNEKKKISFSLDFYEFCMAEIAKEFLGTSISELAKSLLLKEIKRLQEEKNVEFPIMKVIKNSINNNKFMFENNEITTIIQDGEPWFLAQNVCDVLGTRTDHIPDILDDDEYKTINPHSMGVINNKLHSMEGINSNNLYSIQGINDGPGNPNRVIISESGLYHLILVSRKPIAKPFQKWVTKEVLPSIRKTGGYQLRKSKIIDEIDLYTKIEYLYNKMFESEEKE